MAHAQKPDFFFRRNGRVHLNRRWRQFSRLLAAKVCASSFIVGSNAGYTMFRGSVKGTGYPRQSPVSPSLPVPCVTVCHYISTGLYCRHISMWSPANLTGFLGSTYSIPANGRTLPKIRPLPFPSTSHYLPLYRYY
jgi:hypothetical protein